MKRILIVCLLGMGLLLPISNITAKELIIKRTIDVTVDDDVIEITSDVTSGTLTLVRVYNSNKVKVIEESCSGYSHFTGISGLPSGLYSVVVNTSLTVYSENINI